MKTKSELEDEIQKLREENSRLLAKNKELNHQVATAQRDNENLNASYRNLRNDMEAHSNQRKNVKQLAEAGKLRARQARDRGAEAIALHLMVTVDDILSCLS